MKKRKQQWIEASFTNKWKQCSLNQPIFYTIFILERNMESYKAIYHINVAI